MPLHVPPAPAPALRSVLAALGSLPTLRPELPLPVHELARVRRQDGPPHARLTGWRFLLHDVEAPGGEEPVAGAAEAQLTADGWAFDHFCGGPYLASTRRALRQAESYPAAYQPRLLSVPELYMMTLWLHHDPQADPTAGSPGGADLLVPLAPAPPGIAPHQPHRSETLLALLTRRLVPAVLGHGALTPAAAVPLAE